MTVPRGASRSNRRAHRSRPSWARGFLPSWPCEFDSRHPLHSERPMRKRPVSGSAPGSAGWNGQQIEAHARLSRASARRTRDRAITITSSSAPGGGAGRVITLTVAQTPEANDCFTHEVEGDLITFNAPPAPDVFRWRTSPNGDLKFIFVSCVAP